MEVELATGATFSHILVLTGPSVVEIVIMPTMLYGAPNHTQFSAGDAEANHAIVEDIVASMTFIR